MQIFTIIKFIKKEKKIKRKKLKITLVTLVALFGLGVFSASAMEQRQILEDYYINSMRTLEENYLVESGIKESNYNESVRNNEMEHENFVIRMNEECKKQLEEIKEKIKKS